MIRATTPTHTFVFDVNPEESFSSILITYAQNGEIILEKKKSDLTFATETAAGRGSVYTASLRLSQQETKLFSAKPRNTVEIQIRALTPFGEALASDKRSIPVVDVLNDEVLL